MTVWHPAPRKPHDKGTRAPNRACRAAAGPGAPAERQLRHRGCGGRGRVAAALRGVHHARQLLREHVVPDAVGGRHDHVARRHIHRAQLRGRSACAWLQAS